MFVLLILGDMLRSILKIAILCVVLGGASIPLSFQISSSPIIVWIGNALGSLFSAIIVIYISDKLDSRRFKTRISKHRMGKKVVTVFDEGEDNKQVVRARFFIDRHGLRIFSFLCPIFPGVLLSTAAVYILGLDKHIYKKWMFAGIFFASAAYVGGYWWIFVK